MAVIQLYETAKPADNFARAVKFLRDAVAQSCQQPSCPSSISPTGSPPILASRPCAKTSRHISIKECNICIVPGSTPRPVSPTAAATHPSPTLENATFISNTSELGSTSRKTSGPRTSRPRLLQ
ncbi:hypothetical protein BJX99DRAFT_263451 [Aspergillus californicus]